MDKIATRELTHLLNSYAELLADSENILEDELLALEVKIDSDTGKLPG